MIQPHVLFKKAAHSGFFRKLLNVTLSRLIPFNGPHRLRIEKIEDDSLEISLPYIRKNLNHLKGLHACALAALSEYTCGLMLSRKLPPGEFRLIMKELNMTYHYQGRTRAITKFSLTEADIREIKSALTTQDAVFKTFEVNTFDSNANHLCTAKVTWQLKNWQAVKSTVS